VQVDPTKPTLKAPGTKHLKLKYHKTLLDFPFKFNSRRYNMDNNYLPAMDAWRGAGAKDFGGRG